MLHARGVTHQLHYLNDFLLLGPLNSQVCALALQMLQVCQELEVPLTVKFSGVQLDTVRMELSLLLAKLACITAVKRES